MSQIGYRVGVWNADGLTNKSLEMELFVKEHHIGVMLVSENHFRSTSYYQLKHQTAQCAAIKVKTDQGEIVVASLYCPPNSPLTANHYEELLSELGSNFIISGESNAHHRLWGSRNSTIRGRTLADIILKSHVQVLAFGGLVGGGLVFGEAEKDIASQIYASSRPC